MKKAASLNVVVVGGPRRGSDLLDMITARCSSVVMVAQAAGGAEERNEDLVGTTIDSGDAASATPGIDGDAP